VLADLGEQKYKVYINAQEECIKKQYNIGGFNITRDEYERLTQLMFKMNREEAHKINSEIKNGEIWSKRDLNLLEGLEV